MAKKWKTYKATKGRNIMGTISTSARPTKVTTKLRPLNPNSESFLTEDGFLYGEFETELKKLAGNSKNADYETNINKNVIIKNSAENAKVNIKGDPGGDISRNLRNLFGLNIGQSNSSMMAWQSNYYNRFKLPVIDDALQRGFGHVFFVRPDCNFLTDDGKTVQSFIQNKTSLKYALTKNPYLLYELVSNNSSVGNSTNDFMMYLSNRVSSFSLSDEYIKTDTYGATYGGYKIAYGKQNTESKSSGSFNASFMDDRNFNVYHLHKIWMDYISDVYRGLISPKDKYIESRILDYATCCYYIVTAEDGESIIFWSKYYGVFPSTAPSTDYAWTKGSQLSSPEVSITYQYSFKEDYNPISLYEFNENSRVGYTDNANEILGEETFDQGNYQIGLPWVGAPFITYNKGTFHLKFKQGPKLN